MKLYIRIPALGVIANPNRIPHNISLTGDEDMIWISLDNLSVALESTINGWASSPTSLDALLSRSLSIHESDFNTRTGYGKEKVLATDVPSTSAGNREALHDYLNANRSRILTEEDIVTYLQKAIQFKKFVGIDTVNDFIIAALLEQLSRSNANYLEVIKSSNGGVMPLGITEITKIVGGANITLIGIDGNEMALLPKQLLEANSMTFSGLVEGNHNKFVKVYALSRRMKALGIENRMIKIIINKAILATNMSDVFTVSARSKTNGIINDNGLEPDLQAIIDA